MVHHHEETLEDVRTVFFPYVFDPVNYLCNIFTFRMLILSENQPIHFQRHLSMS